LPTIIRQSTIPAGAQAQCQQRRPQHHRATAAPRRHTGLPSLQQESGRQQYRHAQLHGDDTNGEPPSGGDRILHRNARSKSKLA